MLSGELVRLLASCRMPGPCLCQKGAPTHECDISPTTQTTATPQCYHHIQITHLSPPANKQPITISAKPVQTPRPISLPSTHPSTPLSHPSIHPSEPPFHVPHMPHIEQTNTHNHNAAPTLPAQNHTSQTVGTTTFSKKSLRPSIPSHTSSQPTPQSRYQNPLPLGTFENEPTTPINAEGNKDLYRRIPGPKAQSRPATPSPSVNAERGPCASLSRRGLTT